MALLKIKDFDPDYRDAFGGYDIKGLDVYSDVNNEKIGGVKDLLVDEQGYFRYFVVDLGFWAFGKKILLPIERSQVDSEGKHLYTIGLTKDQVEGLPEFNESLKIDDDRRDRVRDTQPRSPIVPPETIPAATTHMPPVPPRPAQQIPVGQVPPVAPQQGYAQFVPDYPVAPDHPATTQPPQPTVHPSSLHPATAPAQPGYPAAAPGTPPGYQPNPVTRETNGQGHSVLQRFEERLRQRRSEPGSHR